MPLEEEEEEEEIEEITDCKEEEMSPQKCPYQFDEDDDNVETNTRPNSAKFNKNASSHKERKGSTNNSLNTVGDESDNDTDINSESFTSDSHQLNPNYSKHQGNLHLAWNNSSSRNTSQHNNKTDDGVNKVKKIKVKLNGPSSQLTGQIISNDRDVNENVGTINDNS